MSLARLILDLIALPLKAKRRRQPRPHPLDPRILVIRRNRMGDMIFTLPLLRALRRHFPGAHIVVACDPPGEPIARACEAVNEVVVLEAGRNRWISIWENAARLQDYDWVLAAKGGFDRRLAVLARLTNAAVRIGFERLGDRPSVYYTEPVALPDNPNEEHQIDTLLRLLQPVGVIKPKEYTINLRLRVPEQSRRWAATILRQPPFANARRFMLINLSSTVQLKFREEDFVDLTKRVLAATDLALGFVASPADQPKAREMAARFASDRVAAVATPEPLDLVALLEETAFLLTPEGGAAHLAAVAGAPALVLWSGGPLEKWRSRAENHTFVYSPPIEKLIPPEKVWEALQPFLPPKK